MTELNEALAKLLDSINEMNVATQIMELYPDSYSEKIILYKTQSGIIKRLSEAKLYQLEIIKKQPHIFSVLRRLFGDKKIDNIINSEIRKRKLNKIV